MLSTTAAFLALFYFTTAFLALRALTTMSWATMPLPIFVIGTLLAGLDHTLNHEVQNNNMRD